MQDTSVVPSGPLPQTTSPVAPLASKLRSSFGSAMVSTPVVPVPASSPPPVAVPTPVAPVLDIISDGEKLGIFSAVLDQLEAEKPNSAAQSIVQAPVAPVAIGSSQPQGTVLDQALPVAVAASTDTLNPVAGAGSAVAKERVAGSDQAAVETATSVQYVEQEPNPEIPVEVESFIQRVENHAETAPHEIVVADGTQEQPNTSYPSRPVVVLPITQQVEDEGAKKSPKFSIRWLIEWSHKIIKMFAGKVIYRQAQAEE